ncbi:MAG: isochorismatase family protein [Ktedonobacteraceae bacterium]
MALSKIDVNDTLVLFADLQAGIADLPLTMTYKKLQKGVSALARLAHMLGLPAIVSGVRGQDGNPTRFMPEIAQGLGELSIHYRTSADSFENQAIKQAVEATGRKTILISGVATEVAVQLPALSACDLGYRVFIVVDAVAGISARTEDAALRRIAQAGGSTVSVATLAGELAGDFSQPVAQQAVGILFEMADGE